MAVWLCGRMRKLSELISLAMKETIVGLICILCLPVITAAHPHLFVEAKLSIVFDEKGLAGIEEQWCFDEMFSAMIIEDFDKNKNQQFEVEEISILKKEAFSNLESFEYFTHVRLDGKFFKVEYVKDFQAEIKNEKIVYKFYVPCPVAAGERIKTIKLSIFDKSYYTAIQLMDSKPKLKGEFGFYEIHTQVKRVKEFICFEEDGFPETMILKFRSK